MSKNYLHEENERTFKLYSMANSDVISNILLKSIIKFVSSVYIMNGGEILFIFFTIILNTFHEVDDLILLF